ncbi:MAG: putative metal-binding motif-containing protein [Myxococcales bacterium]|nr:putative metal-binding motif-containing protein [Myxococcales bacterium]
MSLAVAALAACSAPPTPEGSLAVDLRLAPEVRSTCLQLSATGPDGSKHVSPLLSRGDRNRFKVVVLSRQGLEGQIELQAHGFFGPCDGRPVLNDESDLYVEELLPPQHREVAIWLSALPRSLDSDGDGFRPAATGGPDCLDDRPSAHPLAAEVCGDQLDTDCDGVPDCLEPGCTEACEVSPPDGGGPDAGTPPDGGFPYPVSNFDPTAFAPQLPLSLSCSAFFDSTTLDGGWCGQQPPKAVPIVQPGGIPAVVLPVRGLTIAVGGSLNLTGSRPVILAVYGDALVRGTINAGASGHVPGPGGSLPDACDGGAGAGSKSTSSVFGGGGGGGFATEGGDGGLGYPSYLGGARGTAVGNPILAPLRGGCPGGKGGVPGGLGGAGGGALQLSASGLMRVEGSISARGGGGAGAAGSIGGGGGGGSGGAILLEGARIEIPQMAGVTANGGGGGEGDGDGNPGDPGADGTINGKSAAAGGSENGNKGGNGGSGGTADAPPTSGENGGDTGGGGGGGGATGRIRLNAFGGGCLLGGLNSFSPSPTGNQAGCP